jgi:hypothetical protein
VFNGVPGNRPELERYGLSQGIISYKRRWFVVLEDAPAVLPTLLAQRRPIRDTTADSTTRRDAFAPARGRSLAAPAKAPCPLAARPDGRSHRPGDPIQCAFAPRLARVIIAH